MGSSRQMILSPHGRDQPSISPTHLCAERDGRGVVRLRPGEHCNTPSPTLHLLCAERDRRLGYQWGSPRLKTLSPDGGNHPSTSPTLLCAERDVRGVVRLCQGEHCNLSPTLHLLCAERDRRLGYQWGSSRQMICSPQGRDHPSPTLHLLCAETDRRLEE